MKTMKQSLNRLWAPWRRAYVAAPQKKGCIFCKDESEIIFTTEYSTVRLNIYPYNNGHLLVAPKRHMRDTALLSREEAYDLFSCIEICKQSLDRVLKPEGYNLGMNISRAAGAGIAGHVHVHIVPRWNGDTNFMPVIHATKVVSQALSELKDLLIADIAKHGVSGKTKIAIKKYT
jgi:ATP adenylyltransferase